MKPSRESLDNFHNSFEVTQNLDIKLLSVVHLTVEGNY